MKKKPAKKSTVRAVKSELQREVDGLREALRRKSDDLDKLRVRVDHLACTIAAAKPSAPSTCLVGAREVASFDRLRFGDDRFGVLFKNLPNGAVYDSNSIYGVCVKIAPGVTCSAYSLMQRAFVPKPDPDWLCYLVSSVRWL